METFQELGLLSLTTGAIIGLGLLIRRRLQPMPGAVAVVIAAVIGIVVGWLALAHLHEKRDRQRMDRAIDSALHAHCSDPVPASPDLAAMHELMCAPDVRFASLKSEGVDVGVSIHKDLIGTALPRVPKDRKCSIEVDNGTTLDIDTNATFSYRRDPRFDGAHRVRLICNGQPVADADLSR
jgi:hypothetical protein